MSAGGCPPSQPSPAPPPHARVRPRDRRARARRRPVGAASWGAHSPCQAGWAVRRRRGDLPQAPAVTASGRGRASAARLPPGRRPRRVRRHRPPRPRTWPATALCARRRAVPSGRLRFPRPVDAAARAGDVVAGTTSRRWSARSSRWWWPAACAGHCSGGRNGAGVGFGFGFGFDIPRRIRRRIAINILVRRLPFEPQHVDAHHPARGQRRVERLRHRAEVLADDDGALPPRFDRHEPQQVVQRIGQVGARRGRRAGRHQPHPRQPQHVVDAQPAGMGEVGAASR